MKVFILSLLFGAILFSSIYIFADDGFTGRGAKLGAREPAAQNIESSFSLDY